MNSKENYWKGVSYWEKGDIKQSFEFFEKGGADPDNDTGFQALCIGMNYYRLAADESENSFNDYHWSYKMFVHAFMKGAIQDNLFAVYHMGMSASKIGTAKEGEDHMHPLLRSVYREVAMNWLTILYDYGDFVAHLTKIQHMNLKEVISNIQTTHSRENQDLDFASKRELKELLEGRIGPRGILGSVLNNNESMIQTLNKQQMIQRLLFVSSEISSRWLKNKC